MIMPILLNGSYFGLIIATVIFGEPLYNFASFFSWMVAFLLCCSIFINVERESVASFERGERPNNIRWVFSIMHCIALLILIQLGWLYTATALAVGILIVTGQSRRYDIAYNYLVEEDLRTDND